MRQNGLKVKKRKTKPIVLRVCFILVLFIFITPDLTAQHLTVKGQVLEETDRSPIQYASIEVWTSDSVLVKGAVTDQKGKFKIEGLDVRKPVIKVQFVGYETKKLEPQFNEGDSEIDLSVIYLAIKKNSLREVLVTGKRNTVALQIDRQVIDAGKFQTAANGTALELLQKMPSITVTNEGEIALRGSTGFIVLLNGKPSNRTPADILSQLPANQIENVEIITTPSVKYDADGRSGIISIITKKEAGAGWSISGNSMFGGTDPLRFGGDLQLNYNARKWSAYMGGDYRRYDIDGHRFGAVRTIINDTLTYLPSDGIRDYRDYQYSFKAGVGYTPDASSSINLSLYHGKKQTDRTADLHYQEYTKTGTISLFDNDFTAPSLNYFNKNLFVRSGTFTTAGIDYSHIFSNKSNLSFLAVYEYSVLGGPLTNSLEKDDTHSVYFEEHSDERSPLHGMRLQADYSLPLFKETKLEFGALWRYLEEKGYFDYERKDVQSGNNWFRDPDFNNQLTLHQQIGGGYIQIGRQLTKFRYNLGLRAEYMHRNLKDNLSVTPFKYESLNLFPSVQGLWIPDSRQKIRLAYSKRIDWPSAKLLSPFKNHRHQETIEIGDPTLKPEISDVVEAAYSKTWNKISVTATAYYNYVKNKVFRVNEIYSPSILLRTYTNAGNATSTGLELSADIVIAKWWKLYASGNIYNFTVKGRVKGVAKNSSSLNYNINANTSLDITKRLKFQWDLTHVSATVTSQGRDSHYLLSNAGFKYTIWNKKGVIGLQVNNIFDTNIQTIATQQADFYSTTDYIKYDRVLQISFGFRINESGKKNKTIKTEYGEKEF